MGLRAQLQTAQQVYDSLPAVKMGGIRWITLEDGWQNNYGDWRLDPEKISPVATLSIKAMVSRIPGRDSKHSYGGRR